MSSALLFLMFLTQPVDQWVTGLGSRSYAVRERSERVLGSVVFLDWVGDAVVSGERGSDAEVSERCRRLRIMREHLELDVLLERMRGSIPAIIAVEISMTGTAFIEYDNVWLSDYYMVALGYRSMKTSPQNYEYTPISPGEETWWELVNIYSRDEKAIKVYEKLESDLVKSTELYLRDLISHGYGMDKICSIICGTFHNESKNP